MCRKGGLPAAGRGISIKTKAPAGAPVGNGTFILLTLGMAYAVRKSFIVLTPSISEKA